MICNDGTDQVNYRTCVDKCLELSTMKRDPNERSNVVLDVKISDCTGEMLYCLEPSSPFLGGGTSVFDSRLRRPPFGPVCRPFPDLQAQ